MSDFDIFSEWEKKQMEDTGGVPAHIHKDLQGSIRFLSLAGSCIELFVPKLLGTMNVLLSNFENTEDADSLADRSDEF